MSQAFKRGDIVRLAAEFPACMRHFDGKGEMAAVEYSYADRYGSRSPRDSKIFSLYFRKHGSVSWYDEELMTMVEESPISDALPIAKAKLRAVPIEEI